MPGLPCFTPARFPRLSPGTLKEKQARLPEHAARFHCKRGHRRRRALVKTSFLVKSSSLFSVEISRKMENFLRAKLCSSRGLHPRRRRVRTTGLFLARWLLLKDSAKDHRRALPEQKAFPPRPVGSSRCCCQVPRPKAQPPWALGFSNSERPRLPHPSPLPHFTLTPHHPLPRSPPSPGGLSLFNRRPTVPPRVPEHTRSAPAPPDGGGRTQSFGSDVRHASSIAGVVKDS
jgi:hypothetical protein